MIALPIISQKKYIINNDSLVCYNNTENRTIALIMLDGEKDSILLNDANNYIDSLQIKFSDLNIEFNKCTSLSNTCITDNNKLLNAINNKNYKLDTRRYIINFSLGLNLVLLLTIIL